MIQVTEIRFNGNRSGNFLSYVSVVINKSLVLRHMRLVKSKRDEGRLILGMPSKQNTEGEWTEIYHPISPDARKELESAVFAAYLKKESEAMVESGTVR